MDGFRLLGVIAGTFIAAVSLSSCIAPDVEVIGAVGLTVDAQARPVLVVEACDGAATLVTLAFDRQGLADDEENEEIASWTTATPAAGKSELALHSPGAPWRGAAIELPIGRGYVAGGQGEGDKQVLTQVAFNAADLPGLAPGTVYRNGVDPDVTTLVARSAAEFSAEVCSRN